MRLDKFLCELNMGSRSQVKALIRQGKISVNGMPATAPEQQIDEAGDCVCYQGRQLSYQPFIYLMLNKPPGVVSATHDNICKTVLDLIKGDVPKKDLFPVGRLDKDAEGLLLITNNGALAHRLLSPRKHVDKTYLVQTPEPLTASQLKALSEGVDMGEGKLSLPGTALLTEDGQLLLTIHEGKFHQVKRMVHAAGSQVLALKRVAFGGIELDKGLKPGESRALTEKEITILNEQ